MMYSVQIINIFLLTIFVEHQFVNKQRSEVESYPYPVPSIGRPAIY